MKQVIVLVASIALGLFIGNLMGDFQAPMQNAVTTSVTQMQRQFPSGT